MYVELFKAYLNCHHHVCALFKVYLNRHANPRKKLLVPCALDPPNPKCYVCASKPEIAVRLNVDTVTVKLLEDKASFSNFFFYKLTLTRDTLHYHGVLPLMWSVSGWTSFTATRCVSVCSRVLVTCLCCSVFVFDCLRLRWSILT